MNQNQLQQMLGGGLANSLQGLPYQYQQIPDTRTDRRKLLDKKINNLDLIEKLENENKEIEEAIKLLDEHPMIEKLTNLLHKLIGR